MTLRALKQKWPLIAVAIFSLAIVIIRAVQQSITVDEADSFLLFVWRSQPILWFNSPNNHVLNTMLETLFVNMFGPSLTTVRLPAMIGATVFITSATALCWRQISGRTLAAVSLACIVFNPYTLDYLVAARGYSLALGFLALALYLFVLGRDRAEKQTILALGASTSVGLSISSNFSFGVVAALTLVVFGAMFLLAARGRAAIRMLCALILPAPLVAVCICGPALLKFKSSELVYGTTSVFEMLGSVVTNSFDGPNPYVVNPTIMPVFVAFRTVAPYLVLVAVLYALVESVKRRTFETSAATPILGIALLAVPLQIALATVSHTPLPLDRTMLPIASVTFLGILLSLETLRQPFASKSVVALLAAITIFFVVSVRSYFREWTFNSNVARVYSVLRQVEQETNNAPVGTNLTYLSALNFYQAVDPIPEFAHLNTNAWRTTGLPEDKEVYVLTAGADDEAAKRLGLRILYSIPADDYPDTEIAVKPSVKVSTLRYLPAK